LRSCSLPRRTIRVASARSVRSSMMTPGFGDAAPKRPGRARPASGARALRARSAIEAHPLGIDKHRIAYFDFDIAAAHRIVGAHVLANALGSVLQQAETDPVAERRRERDGGHVALIVVRGSACAERQEMGAGAQHA